MSTYQKTSLAPCAHSLYSLFVEHVLLQKGFEFNWLPPKNYLLFYVCIILCNVYFIKLFVSKESDWIE